MSTSAALRTALRCRCCRVYSVRSRILLTGARALGTAATSGSNKRRFDHTSLAASALCVGLIGAGAFVASQDNDASDASAESWIQKIRTLCEPRRFDTQQPKNVMLNRMRSLRGRNLNEKYNVNWNTVLGEGAYGSVHPARLAATGEKVSYLRETNDAN